MNINAKQQKAIDAIRAQIVELKSLGKPDEHEFKQFRVTDNEFFLSLVCEYGHKGDEGKMTSLICRDYRVFHIGRNGGVQLMTLDANIHTSYPKNVRGIRAACVYWHKTARKPAKKIALKRNCRGSYSLTAACPGERNDQIEATVKRFSIAECAGFNGWIARAEWTPHLYTDPVATYAEAKRHAEAMIEERIAEMANRGKVAA